MAFVLAALFTWVLFPASGVAAAPADDGLWYYDAYHIQDAHDAGFTGEGVTIAVMDTGVNLEVPTLVGADVRVQPTPCFDRDGEHPSGESTDAVAVGHGTNIVSFLVGSGAGYPGQTGVKGVAPDATVLFWRVAIANPDAQTGFECLDSAGQNNDAGMAQAIYEAIDADVDIISVSMGEAGDPVLLLAIANAEHAGIPVVAALPNSSNIDFATETGEFPGVANGVVSVQADSIDGQVQTVTNTTDVAGPGVGILVQGVGDTWETQETTSGTSIATPIVAGFLALVKQKYPAATGNQLIQTLIRNTGKDDHELAFSPEDGYGYGSASATHMLKVDPTQYEDVNPLIRTDADSGVPTADMIANPPSAEEYLGVPDDGESPLPEEPTGLDLSSLILPALLSLGGLLVVIAIIVIIVLATRRSRTPPGAATGGSV